MTEKEAADALREELPQERCAEHQCFLSFNDDDMGIAFREWWSEKGAAVFAEWFRNLPNGPEA